MKLTPNPRPFHYHLGARGEVSASNYLIRHGYQILEKNFKCPLGEIDLIAEKKGVLAFIEVKTRTGSRFGFPEEAVHPAKQKKIIRCALWYLKAKNKKEVPVSFDVVGILPDAEGNLVIRHIPHAFSVPDEYQNY